MPGWQACSAGPRRVKIEKRASSNRSQYISRCHIATADAVYSNTKSKCGAPKTIYVRLGDGLAGYFCFRVGTLKRREFGHDAVGCLLPARWLPADRLPQARVVICQHPRCHDISRASSTVLLLGPVLQGRKVRLLVVFPGNGQQSHIYCKTLLICCMIQSWRHGVIEQDTLHTIMVQVYTTFGKEKWKEKKEKT